MEVKDAIAKAKQFFATVFSEEDIQSIRLEEVSYDDQERAWQITLGIMRPSTREGQGQIAAIMNPPVLRRAYKVVIVPDDERKKPSIKFRGFDDP